MIVVADASPLIFLAKVRRLDLIFELFGRNVLVTDGVRDEVLSPTISPAESHLLSAFLEYCKVLKVARPRHFAAAMSRTDSAALTLAIRKHADVLLADDRITRRMAEVEGIKVVGTLGILLKSMKRGLVSRHDVKRHLDDLVRSHGFRIGIELYEATLEAIAGADALPE